MPKTTSRATTGDVTIQRPIQPNLFHGSRRGSGSGLTSEVLRRQDQLAFLQQEVAAEDLAAVAPLIINLDALRRSLLGSDGSGSSVSPSVATAHKGPRPRGTLVLVGDPEDDDEDRVQQLQRAILAERVQREKEHAVRLELGAKLQETLAFIDLHGHHSQAVKEAKSVDSIEEVVCRIAACKFACRNAQGRSSACHLRQRLDRLSPARPVASGSRAPPANGDFVAVDDRVPCRFPAPENQETMMCDMEPEPQPPAASASTFHHTGPATFASTVPRTQSAASTATIHHAQPTTSTPSVHRLHRVVKERMEMDEEAAGAMISDARATAPSRGADNRFALVEEFPNTKSVSDPSSPNVEDAPSERSGVEGRLAQLEWENKVLLDQMVVAKQTMLKHAEHIRKLQQDHARHMRVDTRSAAAGGGAKGWNRETHGSNPTSGIATDTAGDHGWGSIPHATPSVTAPGATTNAAPICKAMATTWTRTCQAPNGSAANASNPYGS